MRVTPTDLREIHGSVYVTETTDGTIIPWKPLSIGEFLEYDVLFKSGLVDHSILENEIFTKCVTDPVEINDLGSHKAGTVTTVVASIMANSYINDIDAFNEALEHSRLIIQHPVHQFVSVICRAYPGYTPDDIYKMDMTTMLIRLAQAEDKLRLAGGLQEPIRLYKEGEEELEAEKPKRFKLDPKRLKEAFDVQDGPKPKKMDLSAMRDDEDIDLGSTKDGETFVVSSPLMVTGLELGDEQEARQMQRDAKTLYADYLKQGNKVKIKTVEQRVAEYQQMVAEKKKKLALSKKKAIEAAKKAKQKT